MTNTNQRAMADSQRGPRFLNCLKTVQRDLTNYPAMPDLKTLVGQEEVGNFRSYLTIGGKSGIPVHWNDQFEDKVHS